MRRHHEELASVPTMLPALSLLPPFAGALWLRIRAFRAMYVRVPVAVDLTPGPSEFTPG